MTDPDESLTQTLASTCPCSSKPYRFLEENEEKDADGGVKLWEIIYTCGVLCFMFLALISDRIGADSVMLVSLTLFMCANIISVEEGLSGFSNEGLLTVLVLFVVAEGISKTGALDWYMGKALGRPQNAASAQIRLMAPIAIVSAFLNNTPVVAVMIPIVQSWGRSIGISAQQLLIPLSFASILGGTCTLIGTSTNLVVAGLLQKRYPDDSSMTIGLFDLGLYGVPIAFAGITYILVFSPCLLPGGSSRVNDKRGSIPLESQEDILLGARVTPWSPAAGRSVKRSTLRDTGGIYLVSVHRSATGNVHRAVGQDFVLNTGDICYFTGLLEGFGEFCEEHGLEVLTSEMDDVSQRPARTPAEQQASAAAMENVSLTSPPSTMEEVVPPVAHFPRDNQLSIVTEDEEEKDDEVPVEVGTTIDSWRRSDEADRSRRITRMIDIIRGNAREEPSGDEKVRGIVPKRKPDLTGAHQVVIASEHELIVVGVNAHDRPGLLLDVSKGLSRLDLNVRHSEASVVGQRSVSIWRCEMVATELADMEEIWSVMNALLENEHGSQAVKQRGLRVIRAVITRSSSLIGKNIAETDFRASYKAAIVAVQKGGRNVPLFGVVFESNDVLVLQVSEDSPLLKPPPADFYKKHGDDMKDGGTMSRSSSVASFVNKLTKSVSSTASIEGLAIAPGESDVASRTGVDDVETGFERDDAIRDKGSMDNDLQDGFFITSGDSVDDIDATQDGVVISNMTRAMDEIETNEIAWKDLRVTFASEEDDAEDVAPTREFLTAMQVAHKSKLIGRTTTEMDLDKLPGVFLVTIDRPTHSADQARKASVLVSPRVSDLLSQDDPSEVTSTIPNVEPIFTAISPEVPLKENDILWFAGSAQSVGDLRKIPGLVSYESDEVEKINEKVHDRRLVEAVVARRGPLVGKSVKEARFRTRYGAAVIAVHRDGTRVQEHPGRIRLQAGDVLLLEAGPTFIRKTTQHDKSFALLAEVEDSAPPRLGLLIPALGLAFAMLAVYTANLTSLLVSALVASVLMVACGILTEQEARDAVNWEVYITIASAFGIGAALVNSGVAGGVATFLVGVGEAVGIGDAGLFGAVYLATFLISNVVTNNAAAALLFPIALDAAEQTGTDRILMSYCLMLGASASFMSPFGYTTNLLIYGPGGYKYKDFLVIGTPMQVVLWILSIFFLVTTTTSNWWISWVVSFLITALVVATRALNVITLLGGKRTKEEASPEQGLSAPGTVDQ